MSDNGIYGYIHDGYTRGGYIAAKDRLHPSLRFTYRPMLSRERAVVSKLVLDAKSPGRSEEFVAEAIARQMISWDLADHLGTKVSIDTAHILRVQPELMHRLYLIAVLGLEGGDEDPDDGREQSPPDLNLERLLETGRLPLLEEVNAGNSQAG